MKAVLAKGGAATVTVLLQNGADENTVDAVRAC